MRFPKCHPWSLVVAIAVGMHLVWAITFWIDPRLRQLLLIPILERVSPAFAVALLFTVAILALVGTMTRHWWLLLAQQGVLVLSAIGAIRLIIGPTIANAPRVGILAFEAPTILLALAHEVAIILIARPLVAEKNLMKRALDNQHAL